MKEEKEKKEISRREFLGKAGTGVAGSYFILSSLKQAEAVAKENPLQPPETYFGNIQVQLTVNGVKHKVRVHTNTTLVELLRDRLSLTGTKVVCNHGECGGCTVVIDKKAVYSCQMLALDADGKDVTTIEGLLKGEELHKVQQAFIDKDGLQCGFCTPGQIMSAYALLLNNPDPSEEEIKTAMAGNICRCSAYPKIKESVAEAARLLKA
ncbi:MAG: (2Fe-2S)-binding protein [Melioribacteraceae bacterium]|nr:(2Fe-2S)-binding protein [Melioribacteraceae bacterium]